MISILLLSLTSTNTMTKDSVRSAYRVSGCCPKSADHNPCAIAYPEGGPGSGFTCAQIYGLYCDSSDVDGVVWDGCETCWGDHTSAECANAPSAPFPDTSPPDASPPAASPATSQSYADSITRAATYHADHLYGRRLQEGLTTVEVTVGDNATAFDERCMTEEFYGMYGQPYIIGTKDVEYSGTQFNLRDLFAGIYDYSSARCGVGWFDNYWILKSATTCDNLLRNWNKPNIWDADLTVKRTDSSGVVGNGFVSHVGSDELYKGVLGSYLANSGVNCDQSCAQNNADSATEYALMLINVPTTTNSYDWPSPEDIDFPLLLGLEVKGVISHAPAIACIESSVMT